MSDVLQLVDEILVKHAGFAQALRRIEQCYEFANGASEPVCMALIGESRTGKSRALETFLLKHPPCELPDGRHVPILSVKAPSKPTTKSLAEVMLEGLGAFDAKRGTECERTRRLKILMKGTQTRMLMIDEFQHFYDKAGKSVAYYVADWLKVLVDDQRCALVVCGLPTCKAVIDQNEQLSGRFLAPVHLSRFRWINLEQRADFRQILAGFHRQLSAHFRIPEFHSDSMAFRFYCATGGLMGYLTKFLKQAVCNSLTGRRTDIGLDDLNKAHEESMWNEPGADGVPRPFDRNFILEPTRDLLQQVARIGTASEFKPVSGREAPKQGHSLKYALR